MTIQFHGPEQLCVVRALAYIPIIPSFNRKKGAEHVLIVLFKLERRGPN